MLQDKDQKIFKKEIFYNLNKKNIKSFLNKEVVKKHNNTWNNTLTNGFRMTCTRISFFIIKASDEDSIATSHFRRDIYGYIFHFKVNLHLCSFIANNNFINQGNLVLFVHRQKLGLSLK